MIYVSRPSNVNNNMRANTINNVKNTSNEKINKIFDVLINLNMIINEFKYKFVSNETIEELNKQIHAYIDEFNKANKEYSIMYSDIKTHEVSISGTINMSNKLNIKFNQSDEVLNLMDYLKRNS